MTKDETLKMALEALEADPLEMVADVDGHMVFLKDKAIIVIKKVLAQPEQEPVAWEQFYPDIGKPQIAFNAEVIGYVAPQPKQEPLAWISTGPASMIHWTADKPAYGDDWVPLYTSPPPQRTWVGLTDEEIKAFDTWHDNREEEVGWCNPSEIVAYIEAKLKEKNT